MLGEGASAVVKKVAARIAEGMIRKEVKPIKQQGLRAISDLMKTAVMNEAHMKYINVPEVRDAVELGLQQVQQQAPEALTLETVRLLYEAAVGKHIDKVMEFESTRRSTQRPTTATGQSSRTMPKQEPPPTGEDIFGDPNIVDDITATVFKTDRDTFARKMGYKDWQDYVAMARKIYSGEFEKELEEKRQ